MRRFYWCESYRMLWEAMESHKAEVKDKIPRPSSKIKESVARADRDDRRVHIHVTAAPFAVPAPAEERGPVERWVLPTKDGRALRFDSRLETTLRNVDLLRLWVLNPHVKSLQLWIDVLRNPGVRVALFQAKGLSEAAALLNRLGATVILDLAAIQQTGDWAGEVNRVLKRYLSDPSWRAQIHPFAWMLSNALHRHKAPPTNRWGLRPGGFTVTVDSKPPAAEPDGRRLARALVEEAESDSALWLTRRRDCLDCDLFELCGGCLSPAEGGRCADECRTMVQSIRRTAGKITKLGPLT
jgi:hypothetical protein